MTWKFAYTPQIWIPIFTILLMTALAVYSWKRRRIPGVVWFMFGCLFGVLWSAGSALEVSAVELADKILWVKFQSIWQLPAATAVTGFILEYAWPGRWITRRNLALLSIGPLLLLILALTNDLHHLAWSGFAFDGTVLPLRGPGFLLLILYGYGLGLLNLIVLAWLFLRSPQHRWPAAMMIAGQVGMRAIYFLESTSLARSGQPLDVLGIAFTDIIYAIVLFGFHFFDPIPLARQAVITQMREGMLVLDAEGLVTSLNPAAARILGASAQQVKGKPVKEVLPSYPDGPLPDPGGVEIELSLGGEQDPRYYSMVISPLDDWRGLEIGRLLLLHDVTGQKQAQAQQAQMLKAQATLQERMQLARELHDSLGQVFAFVNAQGQTVRRLLSRGELATADEYVGRLVDVAREADADIRESILGLRVSLSEPGFFPALSMYLAHYEKSYGIHTELGMPETSLDGGFEPLVEVQLLRILQEALTNVRKHAHAERVRIAFDRQDGWMLVTVQDDGLGFDPQGHSDVSEGHVGLSVMRERAEELGGSLSLLSEPGQGTRVVVKVPVKGNGPKGAGHA
jgi:signal transduction histidine kinase